MPKRTAVTLVAILAALSFTIGLAFAAVAAKTITGEVIAANRSAQTLVINAEGKEMTFSVVEKAAAALATLKPGDRVTVSYAEADGKLTAQSITNTKG